MSAIACGAEGSGSAITGTALEALECQVAVLAEDGEVVLANKAWRKLAGAGAKSAANVAPGANFLQSMCSSEIGRSDQIVSGIRAVLARRIDQFLFDYRCDTNEQWFRMSVNRCDVAGAPYAVITHRGIRSALEGSQDVQRLSGNLTRLVNSVPSLIWSVTDDGRLDYCNGTWTKMIGAAAGCRVTDAMASRLSADDCERRTAECRSASQRGEPYVIEYRMRGVAETDAHWYTEQGTPLRDRLTGKLTGWAVIATPSDNHRQVEDDLRATLRAREELFVTLLHELRNPLAPIANALELLGCRPQDVTNVGIARGIIQRQFGQLRRLIEDLVDLSQLATGRFALKPRVVDLRDVLKVALETAQPLLELRRHELAVSVPDQPLRLWADPERLVQVLSNLLVNAAKYTPVGGHITVSVEQQGDHVRIRVRDNGVGIPQEKLSEIFRLFSRGAVPMSLPDTGGLGVGLAVARQLIDLHGGSLTAYSAGEGKGSEFSVSLPSCCESTSSRHSSERSGESERGR
jgi:signal transduction histidine kinase